MPATATPKPVEALDVQLPVCPICLRVGKIPLGHFGGKSTCSGPIGESHKRVSMKPRLFREVEDEQ
jgi:hypothetical protein